MPPVMETIADIIASLPTDVDVNQLALQRKRYSQLNNEEWRFLLQQVEGQQRMRQKLPEITSITGWQYPPRLNLEQASSQWTASYKRDLIATSHPSRLTDLTGGFGIDFYYMRQVAAEVHYVERNAELCHLLEHNLRLIPDAPPTFIHNTTAESFLDTLTTRQGGVFFLDPARRSSSGSKVFLLEDCEPNLTTLLPTIQQHADAILLKLSPMLDTSAAVRSLHGKWQTHILACSGEVKEVLLWQSPTADESIHATDLLQNLHFEFTREEEQCAKEALTNTPTMQRDEIREGMFLYEPHPAILKAGAFYTLAKRYNVSISTANTHLYFSNSLIGNFPGRKFQIIDFNCSMRDMQGIRANIICRNFGQTAEQLRSRLKVKDGGDQYLIGIRLATSSTHSSPTLILAKRVQ